ncbi:MAG: flagellar hook-basal body protein [Acidobacteriota bacterium]
MSHTIYMAFAGMRSRAQALDVAANNLANMRSAGFKKDRVYFQIDNSLSRFTPDQLALRINGPAVRARVATDFTPGSLTRTGDPLHLALGGEGFFTVETPQGVRYTRNGTFLLSRARELVTSQGYRVGGDMGEGETRSAQNQNVELSPGGEILVDGVAAGKVGKGGFSLLGESVAGEGTGESRPLVFPEGDVEVSSSGVISVDGVEVGKLHIVHFKNLERLKKVDNGFFEALPGAEPVPPTDLKVYQGVQEESNVNPVAGLAEMISITRTFEMLSRAVRSLKEDVDDQMINGVAQV